MFDVMVLIKYLQKKDLTLKDIQVDLVVTLQDDILALSTVK